MSRRPVEGEDLGVLDITLHVVEGLGCTRHVCNPRTRRVKTEKLRIRKKIIGDLRKCDK